MTANKLKKFLLALSATCVIGLTGCDVDVDLTEEQGNAKILDLDGITSNKLQEIYDALVSSGDTNSSKVLNNVLLAIAKSKFGDFYSELRPLCESASADWSSFLASHKVFASKEEAEDFYGLMIETIQKSFLSTIKNSSYQERSIFREELFLSAMQNDLYDIADLPSYKETQVFGEITYADAPDYFTDYLDTYKDYISRSILEDAYRKALTEQYLMEKNYGVLGRSYARKVQYIALKDNSDKSLATQKLVKAYARDVLAASDADLKKIDSTLTDADIDEMRNLHFLDQLYKGYFPDGMSTAVTKIYTDAGFTAFAAGTDTVATYEETTYGAIAKDYSNLSHDRWTTGSATDFTNSGAYAIQTGLKIKTRDIQTQSNVTEGWYTNSGLSSMASDLKTRLFKITVANEVDNLSDAERAGTTDPEANKDRSFGWYVSGSYYMVNETFQTTDDVPYCLYDKDSSTWYIVRVDEAVKGPKLAIDGDKSYDKMTNRAAGAETQHQIALEIADMLGDSDTYKKAANQHWVEEAAMAFHDDTVYEYFEATFPDLFD